MQAVASGAGLSEEFAATRSALWSVFDAVQPGDVLVVQAFGDRSTGCVGEMLVGYHMQQGGAGVVVDGCVRDVPILREHGFPVWSLGATPNSATQGAALPLGLRRPDRVRRGPGAPRRRHRRRRGRRGGHPAPARLDGGRARPAPRGRGRSSAGCASREGGSLSRYYPLVDDSAWREYEAVASRAIRRLETEVPEHDPAGDAPYHARDDHRHALGDARHGLGGERRFRLRLSRRKHASRSATRSFASRPTTASSALRPDRVTSARRATCIGRDPMTARADVARPETVDGRHDGHASRRDRLRALGHRRQGLRRTGVRVARRCVAHAAAVLCEHVPRR